MKVSKKVFTEALKHFETNVVATQATSMNKFVMGVAFGRLNAKADKMVEKFLDAGGLVDVDALRADVEAGMEAVGDDVLDVVPEIDSDLRLMGVTIKAIKITKDDFKDFFDNILPSVATTTAA